MVEESARARERSPAHSIAMLELGVGGQPGAAAVRTDSTGVARLSSSTTTLTPAPALLQPLPQPAPPTAHRSRRPPAPSFLHHLPPHPPDGALSSLR
ncbi:hypothetical protein E2C01_069978 [Portunus trituberculatus]|uniref:Uncharacterized protein n=1 Tax=Portunus trituberculatus TaxID=210409 RepID=A0A5B7I3Y0_PORTR|nr:hypothetical protein [Portunus trituberculatus]